MGVGGGLLSSSLALLFSCSPLPGRLWVEVSEKGKGRRESGGETTDGAEGEAKRRGRGRLPTKGTSGKIKTNRSSIEHC